MGQRTVDRNTPFHCYLVGNSENSARARLLPRGRIRRHHRRQSTHNYFAISCSIKNGRRQIQAEADSANTDYHGLSFPVPLTSLDIECTHPQKTCFLLHTDERYGMTVSVFDPALSLSFAQAISQRPTLKTCSVMLPGTHSSVILFLNYQNVLQFYPSTQSRMIALIHRLLLYT